MSARKPHGPATKVRPGVWRYRGWLLYADGRDWIPQREGGLMGPEVYRTRREAQLAVDAWVEAQAPKRSGHVTAPRARARPKTGELGR